MKVTANAYRTIRREAACRRKDEHDACHGAQLWAQMPVHFVADGTAEMIQHARVFREDTGSLQLTAHAAWSEAHQIGSGPSHSSIRAVLI